MSGDLHPGKSKKEMKRERKDAEAAVPKTDSVESVWVDGKLLFPLRKPIIAYNETLKELTLREPGSEDILTVGNPVMINMTIDPPDIKFDDRKMGAMIAQLCGIPISSVGQINPRDFVALSWIIAPFFLPA